MCEIFRNGYGLDQLREGLLLKESNTKIYHLRDTGKLPAKNNSHKIARFRFQVIAIRLPPKQSSGVWGMAEYGKKLKLAAKIRLTKRFLMASSAWLIHLHTRN